MLAPLSLLSHCKPTQAKPVAESRDSDKATLGKFHSPEVGKMFLLKPLRFYGAQGARSSKGTQR